MNKLSVSIVLLYSLLALSLCCLNSVEADDKREEPEVSVDELEFSPVGEPMVVDNFGARDVIEDGVPNLVDLKVNRCAYARHERKCKICCGINGDSYLWTIRPNPLRMAIFECTCHHRVYADGE